VAPEKRALVRLIGERVAIAAEAVLARADRTRPRGAARAAALSAFLSGDPPPAADAGARATALGLSPGASYRVALAATTLNEASLQRTLGRFGQIVPAGMIDGAVALVVEDRGDRPMAREGAAPRPARAPLPGAAAGWLALSAPAVGLLGLHGVARQARFVAALLATGLIRGPVCSFDSAVDLGPFRLLYPLWGNPELEGFAIDVLGDLPRHDRRGELRRTLLTYLETGGAQVEAAERLKIHRNTLAYRLRQVKNLTGNDPADPATRLLFHLALLAAAMPPAP
jgi:hypothetical protein